MTTQYNADFYLNRHKDTLHAARTILSHVLDIVPAVSSAVDFGCGVGTFLSVLQEKGVTDIQGVDGPWVQKEFFVIPESRFLQADFEQPIVLNRRYDLAISLEVAEHVQAANAERFIKDIAAASQYVLFSAAIPHQGGHGYINEQWPRYWCDMFSRCGFVPVDAIRRRIWNDQDIPVWYRQNVMMYVHESRLETLSLPCLEPYTDPDFISIVHPEYYMLKVQAAQNPKR